MESELIKTAASKYLTSIGYRVLDLFFKQPCDKCIKTDGWDEFNLLPDLLVKNENNLFFSFIITEQDNLSEIEKFMERHSDILPYNNFLVENTNLYNITSLNDLDNKDLLINKLDIPTKINVGSSSKTLKSQTGEWKKKRSYGQRGEDELDKFLMRSGATLLNLNFNAPCDDCVDIQNWRRFNKLPDGIAKLDDNLFLYDSKAKSGRYLVINERDYDEYRAKLDLLPIKVYILIFTRDWKKLLEIYEHDVNLLPKRTEKQWDGNYTVILDDELNQVY